MKTIQYEQKPIPPDIQRQIEKNLRAGWLSPLDKFWIALTSIGLGALLLGALGLAALIMMSGCAKPAAATSHPEEPLRVVVLATVPGDAWFCMEDPHIDGTLRQPAVRFGHIVCPLTVNQLRRAINQLQATD